ncbi:MAG: protein phosphatase 2C domain-containing protein [Myxococcota bacterium]
MKAAAESITGRRENNEDSFSSRDDLGLFVVADGMGGHEGGEVASRVAVETLVNFFGRMDTEATPAKERSGTALAEERMALATRMAHAEVTRLATGPLADMGTTLVALWKLGDGQALVAHLGDSRVYRLRGSELVRLTRDHSFLAELDAAGAGSLVGQLPGAFSAMVTRCISARMDATPETTLIEVRPGDTFLLCTDGLTDVVDDDDIAAVLLGSASAADAAAELVDVAYEAGSLDNITALVVDA